MRTFLTLLFGAILLWMFGMTAWVAMHKSILQSGNEFSWLQSPWACATLFDAYFGFLTFFVWVCFKERTLLYRVVWFVLIMSLGNIAMSAYMLIQLLRLRPEEPLTDLLTRSS